jgi:hypothetical protein
MMVGSKSLLELIWLIFTAELCMRADGPLCVRFMGPNDTMAGMAIAVEVKPGSPMDLLLAAGSLIYGLKLGGTDQ